MFKLKAAIAAVLLLALAAQPALAADTLKALRADTAKTDAVQDARIKALESAVAALQAQPAAQPPTSATTPPVPTTQPAPSAPGVTVSTTAGLLAAVKTANGGDTIRLKAGTYSGFGVDGAKFSPAVTITSDDPTHPAVLTNFNLANCQGLHVSGVELYAQPGTWSFRVAGCADVAFDRNTFHGATTAAVADYPMGLLVQASKGFSFTRNDAHHLQAALMITADDVVVTGNAFHDIRSDAVDMASVNRVKVTGNFVTNQVSVVGDHADAFQSWTVGTAGNSNVEISGNVVLRGAGGAAQGSFNEGGGISTGYLISDNFFAGTMFNGIAASGIAGLAITGNEIWSFGTGDNLSWIRSDGDTQLTITGNKVLPLDGGAFSLVDGKGVVLSGNTAIPAATDGGVSALKAWLTAHPAMAWVTIPTAPTPTTTGPATPPPAIAPGVTVSTTAGLLAAIQAAKPGDTLRLAAGTYTGIGTIDGLSFTTPITVTSADTAHKAVLNNFAVSNSQGINFTDLKLQLLGPTLNAFPVSKSARITFSRVEIAGLAVAINGDETQKDTNYNGIGFSDCVDCALSNSELHHLSIALQGTRDTRLMLLANHFHHIRIDATEVTQSVGTSYLKNFFHDFYPLTADHPDAIQLWTDNIGPSSQITVRGNVILRNALGGTGAGHMQGVFFDDLNDQGYSDITIDGNFLAGTGLNGIYPAGSAVHKSTGIRITNNEIWSLDDTDLGKSWIRMQNTVGAVVTGNKARLYLIDGNGNDSLTQTGNLTNGLSADRGATELAAWVATHPDMAWVLTGADLNR